VGITIGILIIVHDLLKPDANNTQFPYMIESHPEFSEFIYSAGAVGVCLGSIVRLNIKQM
jgi:hypothetical protein